MLVEEILPPPLVDPTKPFIGRILLHLMTDFRRRFLQRCKEHGYGEIRGSHTGLLAHITRTPINATTLAERAGITKQGAGKVAHELLLMGYVDISVDVKDRRALLIQLSPQGQSLKAELKKIDEEVRHEYRSIFGDTTLIDFEERLLQAW